MFSFESRRAQASISLNCETGPTSCITLTRKVFTAGGLNRKRKKKWKKRRKIAVLNDWLMNERTKVLLNVDCFSRFIEKRRVAEFELYSTFYLWATIIKIGISYQVSIIFKMSGVIQFTDISDSSILGIFFEVSTDAVVVHVAEKLTVIQVFNVFGFDFMVYQTFFSKEEVIWKQHCAISLWNKTIKI